MYVSGNILIDLIRIKSLCAAPAASAHKAGLKAKISLVLKQPFRL